MWKYFTQYKHFREVPLMVLLQMHSTFNYPLFVLSMDLLRLGWTMGALVGYFVAIFDFCFSSTFGNSETSFFFDWTWLSL